MNLFQGDPQAKANKIAERTRLDRKILTLQIKLNAMPNCQGRTAIDSELADLMQRRAKVNVGASR